MLVIEMNTTHETQDVKHDDDDDKNIPPTIKNKDKKETVEKPKRVRTAIKSTISKITKKYDVKTELSEVKNKWINIKQKFAEKYHALAIILEMAEIKEIDGKGLVITVPFSLHKDKLSEREPKLEIERILEEIF